MSIPFSSAPVPESARERDATTGQVVTYALGNAELALANQFFNLISFVIVVALGMNPLLIALIIGLKTLFDAVTDPVMAQITDNARTRWGRRVPFILVGGVGRSVLLLAVFLFFPRDVSVKTNEQIEAERVTVSAPASVEGAAGAESSAAVAAPVAKPVPAGMWARIAAGFDALTTDENPYHRRVFYYLLGASVLMTLLGTVVSVPYYALGIELAPSYDGRTRVVAFRTYVDKVMQLVQPWIIPFCFMSLFTTALDGLVWYGVAAFVVGVGSTVAIALVVKEPAYAVAGRRAPAIPLFRSMWLTARNPHFLKILALYVVFGFANGIFAQVGGFLVAFWIFGGDVVKGGMLNGYAHVVAVVLGFASIPLIQWACRRLGKHVALRYAILWMAAGAALTWVLYDPARPWMLLVMPFFFSVGIGSFYTILPTLMADVTDIDELENGVRREGMFGAVMAFLLKAILAFQAVAAAAILGLSGFDAAAGAMQAEGVFDRMRMLTAWVPAGLMVAGMLLLLAYPLTRARMDAVKAELVRRRAERLAAGE